jgi:hypothetical protein
MSYQHNENRNSENINAIANERIINRQPNRMPVLRNRCCSFCREPGHTINYCNDVRLQNFKELCELNKEVCDYYPDSRNKFKEWVIDFCLENPTLIKAFAIRYCGSTTRDTIQANIDSIVEHFYDEYYGLPDLIPENDIVRFPNMLNDENIDISVLLNWLQRQALSVTRGYEHPIFTIHSQVEECIEETTATCECNICYTSFEKKQFVKFNCNHEFCKDCFKGVLKTCNTIEGPKCAFCRSKIENLTFKSQDIKEEFCDLINEPSRNET